MDDPPLAGFYGEWIAPIDGFHGNHMYVTNGQISFDFHGYSLRDRLLKRYWKGHQSRYPGWEANITKIDFSLLDTIELNARKHRGPDQYFDDPVPRAKRFIDSKRLPAWLQEFA